MLDNIYLDDLPNYQRIIGQRKAREYLVSLAITHTQSPQELQDQLLNQSGDSYIDHTEPDKKALTELQGILSPNMQKP